MLVIKNADRPAEGEWMEIELWGETIRIKVRARTEKVVEPIKARFKGMKEGRKKDEAVFDAMCDHLIEDFEGLGEEDADGTIHHLEVNIENKKKLLLLPVPIDKESIYTRVLNRANELGFQVTQEHQKN